MKAQKKLDKILALVQDRVQEEVGGLLGAEFVLSGSLNQVTTKEEFFDQPTGKQVVAKIGLTGEIEGKGCLLISVKDAIRLGGTLIMLPENELEDVCSGEDYNEETEDSYGEIANIIAGAYTKTFEEMYPKSFRFVRKEQQVIVPMKVDVESEDPIPEGTYYQVTNTMKIGQTQMGDLVMLMPAELFGLEPVEKAESVQEEPQGWPEESQDAEKAESEAVDEPPEAKESEVKAAPAKPKFNQKKFDKILDLVQERVQEEVGGLLGAELALSGSHSKLTTKEEFFDQPFGKQVVAKVDLTGEIEGKGCLLISVKDAIRLGGTLIMLPESELEDVCASEDYNEETEDSYGEIANIIAGAYTKTFEEMYPKSFRFVRKEQEVIVPMKVDVESDEPVSDGTYCQVTATMQVGQTQMGDLTMLMPAEPFGMEPLETAEPVMEDAQGSPEKSQDTEKTESETVDEPPEAKESEVEAVPAKAKFNQKKFDKILDLVQERVQEEVGGLLGAELALSDSYSKLTTKEEFFDQPSGKQVIAKVDLTGELEGRGCLLIGVKDAIRLGGTLIMLPESELEDVCASEDYNEETEDSYGEIANIIAGAYTKTFEEMYPKSFRFVRKEQEVIVPMKVDVESDEPISDGTYCQVTATMQIGQTQMGDLTMLMPAEPFGMNPVETEEPAQEEAQSTQKKDAVQTDTGSMDTPPENSVPVEKAAPEKPKIDLKKHQKKVDALLEICRKKVGDEIGAMLAVDVQLKDPDFRPVEKEDYFFDEASGKQVLAYLDASGDVEDKSYLLVGLKDAIRIGGILIMLPPTELESTVSEEDFGEDSQDAYGEIANIIAGVYTAVFEEQFVQKIRFVRKELEQVVPLKVDAESDEPFPDQEYYMSSCSLEIDGKALGKIQMLMPMTMLQLDGLGQEEEIAAALEENKKASISSSNQSDISSSGESVGVRDSVEDARIDILLIGDDEDEVRKIEEIARQREFGVKRIGVKDNVNNYLPGEVQAVFLVVSKVNEKALGVAIKVSSSCSVPLIAAGPGWTRSMVIKAVKYGVRDILLTPASDADIEEKIDMNLAEMAA